MEYLTIKGTDIRVSRLCMGGCPMGGYGWGEVSQQELVRSVHSALDAGLNFFDTADIYGMGDAERTLGDALFGRRAKAVINAKFGVRRTVAGETFYDNSPEWINSALEGTLKRLRTDYVDAYQVHYRDGRTPLAAVVERLEHLKREGKIRSYGLSNISLQDSMELSSTMHHFCSFQNEYSLAKRLHEEEICTLSADVPMTPMTWGSLGQGVLTGKYDAAVRFAENDRRSRAIYHNFHGEKLKHNLGIVERLQAVAATRAKPVSSVAIRWILDRIPGSVVIAGIKTPQQLQENLHVMGWELSRSEMLDLHLVSRGSFC